MNVFHHYLEAIKAAGFGQLYFAHKIHRQVFIYNTIAGGKKSKDVRNEMTLTIVQVIPILHVAAQVYFFCRPKTGFMLFILFPYFGIFNGEDNKTVFVFS